MVAIKNWIIKLFTDLDKTDLKIIKIGLKFCFAVLLFAIIVLAFYLSTHHLFFYELGMTILKLSLYLAIEFVICGFVTDIIKKRKLRFSTQ